MDLSHLMTGETALAVAIVCVAGLMRGFAGVGSGMLMAPFFVVFYGPAQTISIIILMELVVTAQLLPSVHKDIDWRVIAPMGAAAACLMPLGNWLLFSLDPALISRLVALLVTVFAVILLTGWRYAGAKPLPVTLGVGAFSGFAMALTSLGNPPVMLYLLSSQDKAATNRANFTGYFAVTLVALLVLMLVTGLVEMEALARVALFLPIFVLCAWIGAKLFRKSNEALYRIIALSILLCAGLYGLLR